MSNDTHGEFKVLVYHGGKLYRDTIEYVGGIVEEMCLVDIDKWGLQELRILMKELNYTEECKYFWHPTGENKVIDIENDDVAMRMGFATLKLLDKTAVVYVEHNLLAVSDIQVEHESNAIEDVVENDVEAANNDVVENDVEVADNGQVDNTDDNDEDEYHPIAESDSVPDDDEFDKYTDQSLHDNNFELSSRQKDSVKGIANLEENTNNIGNENVVTDVDFGAEGDYESDGIDEYLSDSENEKYVQLRRIKYNPMMMSNAFKFTVGMEFSTLKEFKDAVRDWNVLQGRCFKFKKNDRIRVRAVCKDLSCNWLVFLSRVANTRTYLVKTVNMTHTCQFVYNNKSANTSWVAKKIVDDVSRDLTYKLKTIVQKIGKDSNLGISLCKAQRAKKAALNALIGSEKDQFAKMWNYLEEMKEACIGNSCGMNVTLVPWSHRPLFDRVYVCLEACKLGFLSGCRLFIGVDSCFLTGTYGGQLLTAVGIDANNQYFPIAWAIVQVENTDNWRWFLNMLLDDIGSAKENRWIFISDQQKGLMKVFDELLDGMEHHFCLRHMYHNFRKKWPGGEYQTLIEAAARATYLAQFQRKMEELKKLNIDAYNWLAALPKASWCRHAFRCHVQCDSLLNNECESFNGRLLTGRDQGPIALLEFVRGYVMDRFVSNRVKVENYRGYIMPKIKKKLEKRIMQSADWIARSAGYELWEATNAYGSRHVVDLSKCTCSCGSFQLCGIPCEHAVKAIHFKGGLVEDYVSKMYSREAYMACYAPAMSPLRGENMWPTVAYPPPLPPPFKRKPGRPKKLRRRDPIEDRNDQRNKLSKKSMFGRCSTCGELGHNKRTCSIGTSTQRSSNG